MVVSTEQVYTFQPEERPNGEIDGIFTFNLEDKLHTYKDTLIDLSKAKENDKVLNEFYKQVSKRIAKEKKHNPKKYRSFVVRAENNNIADVLKHAGYNFGEVEEPTAPRYEPIAIKDHGLPLSGKTMLIGGLAGTIASMQMGYSPYFGFGMGALYAWLGEVVVNRVNDRLSKWSSLRKQELEYEHSHSKWINQKREYELNKALAKNLNCVEFESKIDNDIHYGGVINYIKQPNSA